MLRNFPSPKHLADFGHYKLPARGVHVWVDGLPSAAGAVGLNH